MEPITYSEWMERWYEDGSSEGNPAKFWIVDQTFYVTPIPSADTTFLYAYFSRPTELGPNNQELWVPDEYRQQVVRFALRDLMERGYSPLAEVDVNERLLTALEMSMVMDDMRRHPHAAPSMKMKRGERYQRY